MLHSHILEGVRTSNISKDFQDESEVLLTDNDDASEMGKQCTAGAA